MQAEVVFHLPPDRVRDYRKFAHLALYARIEDAISPRGGIVRAVAHQDRALPVPQDGNLHIVENGFSQGPGMLNATLAYIAPYWHLDPQGVLARSSINARKFDPGRVEVKPAMRFFRDMRERLVAPRRSRYAQQPQVSDLPKGAIAVFLQGRLPHTRGTTHCSTADMLRAVALGAGGRPVLVKPHPHPGARRHDVRDILTVQDEGLQLIPTDANVHDILAACAVTVSFNSAVALEGFLHRKPAILFGQSDFHHWADPVTAPDQFPRVLGQALARRGGYAQFLDWYFNQNCLNIDAANFPARLLRIFADAGFDAGRLGLHHDSRLV